MSLLLTQGLGSDEARVINVDVPTAVTDRIVSEHVLSEVDESSPFGSVPDITGSDVGASDPFGEPDQQTQSESTSSGPFGAPPPIMKSEKVE
jgi:hypothetical protein